MPDPWDIPPFPEQGDDDEDKTYCGVGHVMSRWEGVEVELAELYCFFVGRPNELEAIKEYGTPRIFAERADRLRDAGERYFVSHPGQGREARFDELLRHVRGWADRRNDVAHGIVQQAAQLKEYRQKFQQEGRMRWCLVPSFYAHRKRDADYRPTYCYVADQLNDFASRIYWLGIEFGQFRLLLDPRDE